MYGKYCGLHNRLEIQETENWEALLRCHPLYTRGILLAVDCRSRKGLCGL